MVGNHGKPAHHGLWHVGAHLTVGEHYACMRKILKGVARRMTHGGQATDPMVAKVTDRRYSNRFIKWMCVHLKSFEKSTPNTLSVVTPKD